jgi:hypothetical protein
MKSLLTVLLFFIVLSGCKKIPAGITTTVSGTVMDDNRGVPIVNAKIAVIENKYKSTGDMAGEFPINNSGTAVSGPDGKYSITFTTNGKGDEYVIGISLDTNYFSLNNLKKIDVGGNVVMDFTAWQLATLKAHIIVKNNPAPPMWVSSGIHASGAKIYGTNNDTIVNLPVIPNRINGITFNIQVPGNKYPSYFIQNVDLSGFSDTYNQTITVYPLTFVQL